MAGRTTTTPNDPPPRQHHQDFSYSQESAVQNAAARGQPIPEQPRTRAENFKGDMYKQLSAPHWGEIAEEVLPFWKAWDVARVSSTLSTTLSTSTLSGEVMEGSPPTRDIAGLLEAEIGYAIKCARNIESVWDDDVRALDRVLKTLKTLKDGPHLSPRPNSTIQDVSYSDGITADEWAYFYEYCGFYRDITTPGLLDEVIKF